MTHDLADARPDTLEWSPAAVPDAGVDVVVIVDADPDMRSLLEAMLDVDERFVLAAATSTDRDGVAAVECLLPDAVLVDLDTPRPDGLGVVQRLRRAAPAARIVAFSSFPDPVTLLEVLRRGADGYVDKATAWAELLPTVAALCEAQPDGASTS